MIFYINIQLLHFIKLVHIISFKMAHFGTRFVYLCVLVWNLFVPFWFFSYTNQYNSKSAAEMDFAEDKTILHWNTSAQYNVSFPHAITPNDSSTYKTKLIPTSKRDMVKMIQKLPEDHDSLYFRLNLKNELLKSLRGGPGNYLKEYKNPCWLSELDTVDPYKHNSYKDYTEHYTGLPVKFSVENAFKEMQSVYAAQMSGSNKTWRLRCVPYVYLAGVTKSGTSDLFGNLLNHPDVISAAVKEPMFWNRRRLRNRLAISSFSHYVDLFDHAAHTINTTSREAIHEKITIDASPSYAWDYDGWQRIPGNKNLLEPKYTLPMAIHAISPGVKIIIILRHPAQRLHSQYKMSQIGGAPKGPDVFHQFVKTALENMTNCITQFGARSCAYNKTVVSKENTHPGGMFLRASMYSIFVEDWMAVFPKDQLLVIKAESYYKNTEQSLNQIFAFLGLESMKLAKGNHKRVINSRKLLPMREDTLEMLNAFYKPFNKRLSEILDNRDFLWDDA